MAVWDSDLSARLVRVVHAEAARIGRTDAGFKKSSWTRVMNLFNNELPSHLQRSRTQAQSHLQSLRAKHDVFMATTENSGFGVCPSTDRPTAPPAVWDEYIASNPKAEEFRNGPLPLYDELHEIFGGITATGRYAVASTNSLPADTTQGTAASQPSSDQDEHITGRTRAFSNVDITESDQATGPSTESSLSEEDYSDNLTPQRIDTHKRPTKRARSSGDRISAALETIARNHERHLRLKSNSKTPEQQAILHFLKVFGPRMTRTTRVKYVRHFKTNSRDAAGFNVLDMEMQLTFLLDLGLDDHESPPVQ